MAYLKNIVLFIVVLLVPVTLLAGKSDVGTTAYPFLKIGVGAKALAMGGAFTGLADDESAAFYNPAGIICFQAKAVTASYMNYIAGIQSGYLAFVLPTTSRSAQLRSDEFDEGVITDASRALALSINYLNYGTIAETDSEGKKIGDFGGSDIAIAFTLAQRVTDRFTVGGSAKFIYQKIDEYSSDALAIDLGLLYRLADGRTVVGAAAANLGFQLSGLSPEHKDPLPIVVKAGLSHRMRGMPLTVAGEIAYPTDNEIYGSLGIEVSTADMPVALRGGYSTFGKNYRTSGDGEKDNTAGFSFGAGFTVGRVAIDYAFLPYANLGSLHRVSLAHRW